MKKLVLFLFLLISFHFANSQWQYTTTKVWFNGGNVGIGITNPAFSLDMAMDGIQKGMQQATSDRWVRFYSPSLNGGDFNNITGGNDAAIIFGNTAGINTVANGFTIAPYINTKGGLRITSKGNVAVGSTDTNGFKFAVGGNMSAEAIYIAPTTTTETVLFNVATNTAESGTQMTSVGRWVRYFSPSLNAGSFNGMCGRNDAGIIFGSYTGTAADNGFTIAPNRSGTSGLRVSPEGNVSIGVSDSYGYALAVNGKMIATEVNVKLFGNWPDYVFEPTYTMPTLEELNAYIKVNKHLPEVPSACAIEENGIKLGEMNMLLLKKVEELTLYIIELQKQNVKQDEVISKLQINK